MFGVRFGFACSIKATVPDTTGAAILAPPGESAGDGIPPQTFLPLNWPLLPAAATTTTPRSTSVLAARASGSSEGSSSGCVPKDMLTTRTPYDGPYHASQLSAAITFDTRPL